MSILKKLVLMMKLLLLLSMLLSTSIAKADDKVLQILFSDGHSESVSLNEEPRTTYQDGNLVISTTNNSVSYPLEYVRRYMYVSVSSGIETPEAIGAAFSSDGETLTFRGLKPHTKIYLYNVAGQLLETVESDGHGLTVISASRMPIGVYIVKVNGGTYKITKR